MPNIITEIGEHKNEDAIDRLIYYMFSSPFAVRTGTNRVLGCDVESIVNSYKLVQMHHAKTDGKQIQHIIIGTSEAENIMDGMAWVIALAASDYIGSRFQCCYAVHHGSYDNPNYVHIHLAVNTVSWLDGNRYHEKRQNEYDLKNYLNSYTQEMYRWKCIQEKSIPWDL